MKILSLYLENFIPIFSGMEKYSVLLDLSKTDNIINVIIGPMGSGKTYILSHLQPFANVGTLDIRNGDDPIISGKDGKKVIVFLKDNSIKYTITHSYIWTGKNHTTKSSILKNNIELNPNGNQGSFKDIIEMEFGIDQNLLRLIRLGPNVVNFIKMKSTERKSFISSMLTNAEIYNFLYKKWVDENRLINTRASVLSNKLNHFHANNINTMENDYDSNIEKIDIYQSDINNLTKKSYELSAENHSLMNNMSQKDFEKEINRQIDVLNNLLNTTDDLKQKITRFKDCLDISEISKKIGKLDLLVETYTKNVFEMENEYNLVCATLNDFLDKKKISGNENHMKVLETTYNELLEKDKSFLSELRGFNCDYTSAYLTNIIGDLQSMNMLINDISQYDLSLIKKIYYSDSSCIKYSQKQIEILGYRKMKIQKLINNINYSGSYESPNILYRPPFCPTTTCPYYANHPYTLKKELDSKDKINEELEKYQSELKDLDIAIYQYEDYPYIYNKLVTLKEMWKKLFPVVSSLKAIKCKSLSQIITNLNDRAWYDYDKIINTIELIEKQQKYFELTTQIQKIQNEINILKIDNDNTLDSKIENLSIRKRELSNNIDKANANKKDALSELNNMNTLYLELSQRSIIEKSYENMISEIANTQENISAMKINQSKINDNISIINQLNTKIVEMQNACENLKKTNDSLKTVINDIRYTQKELFETLEEQKYMQYLVDAVSSKEGIPLQLIKIFLESCREIINDLIYDICEDSLEIDEFNITDTDFNIPFIINGIKVDDVSKASQGQVSIASMAISFALIRETMNSSQSEMLYNIMLLDEMDGPLYKDDRNRTISVLMKQLKAINAEQAFLITHNNTFEGYPINIIMTSDEIVSRNDNSVILRV